MDIQAEEVETISNKRNPRPTPRCVVTKISEVKDRSCKGPGVCHTWGPAEDRQLAFLAGAFRSEGSDAIYSKY